MMQFSHWDGSLRNDGEAGNATVGFTALVGLFLLLIVTIMASVLTWYVRETLMDSAIEGARAGAFRGSDAGIAIARTRDLITTTLPEHYAEHITAHYEGDLFVVEVTAPAPLLGLISNTTITVEAHAPIE